MMRRWKEKLCSVAGWIRFKLAPETQPKPHQEILAPPVYRIPSRPPYAAVLRDWNLVVRSNWRYENRMVDPIGSLLPSAKFEIISFATSGYENDEVAKLMINVARATCVGGKKGRVFAHHARIKLISEVMKSFKDRNGVGTVDVRIGIIEILNDRQAGQFASPHHNYVECVKLS